MVFYMKNKLLSPVILVKKDIKQPGCEQNTLKELPVLADSLVSDMVIMHMQ